MSGQQMQEAWVLRHLRSTTRHFAAGEFDNATAELENAIALAAAFGIDPWISFDPTRHDPAIGHVLGEIDDSAKQALAQYGLELPEDFRQYVRSIRRAQADYVRNHPSTTTDGDNHAAFQQVSVLRHLRGAARAFAGNEADKGRDAIGKAHELASAFNIPLWADFDPMSATVVNHVLGEITDASPLAQGYISHYADGEFGEFVDYLRNVERQVGDYIRNPYGEPDSTTQRDLATVWVLRKYRGAMRAYGADGDYGKALEELEAAYGLADGFGISRWFVFDPNATTVIGHVTGEFAEDTAKAREHFGQSGSSELNEFEDYATSVAEAVQAYIAERAEANSRG